mgnify:CR=1 FL=1
MYSPSNSPPNGIDRLKIQKGCHTKKQLMELYGSLWDLIFDNNKMWLKVIVAGFVPWESDDCFPDVDKLVSFIIFCNRLVYLYAWLKVLAADLFFVLDETPVCEILTCWVVLGHIL